MSWSCETCTFANVGARSVCEMCEAPRPPPSTAVSATAVAAASWACAQCTFANVGSASVCAMCGCQHRAAAAAAVSPAEVSEEQLRNLQNLGGFSRAYVLHALELKNQSVTDAASWLLLNPQPAHNVEDTVPTAAAAADVVHVDDDDDDDVDVLHVDTDANAASAEELQERLRQAQAKEDERLQREQERRARRREEVARHLADRRKEMARQKAVDAKQQHIDRVQLARQRLEHDQRNREHELQANRERLEEESKIPDIPSAVQVLKRRYGMQVLKETLALLAKIVENILDHPEQEKFRRLDSTTAFFRNRIRGRLGTLAILRCLGFVVVPVASAITDQTTDFWVLQHPDLPHLAAERDKMLKVVNRPESKIPELLAQADACSDFSGGEESILFLAMALKSLLENALVASNSTAARRIDTRSDVFVGFFAKVPQAAAVLQLLGYSLAPPFWSAPKHAVAAFPKAIRDLTREIARRTERTAVHVALRTLRSKNSFAKTRALVEFVAEALSKVVNDMHSTQHHHIRFRPLLKKSGAIAGLKAFVRALGVEMVALDEAKVPYPYAGGGVEPYRLRLQLLRRSWTRISAADAS